MKKLLSLFVIALFVVPGVLAVSVGTGIGVDITPEEFAPLIWGCGSRVVLDDAVESGRTTDAGAAMAERINNYAFEGEQIQWTVLVMDKNKIEEIEDVVATIGATQGTGNDIEVECVASVDPNNDGDGDATDIDDTCNARIGEEFLDGAGSYDVLTMQYYDCTLTVETPDSMYGEYFTTVEAIGVDGEAIMDENEYWYLNPTIALTIDGDLNFDDVRPGAVAYSETLLIGNDADDSSGVMLDMFISTTDFYDPVAAGARCPTSNRLKASQNARSSARLGAGLASSVANGATSSTGNITGCNLDTADGNQTTAIFVGGSVAGATGFTADNADHLCYFASQGVMSTATDPRADPEGYVPMVYSDTFTTDFYNDAEIIQEADDGTVGDSTGDGTLDLTGVCTAGADDCYHRGNVLSPGAEVAVTFKLGLPEPCVGDFSDGDIYFWGEAI